MGAGSSKPESTPGQHVFSADAPVRFSSSLVDSLQSSPESDTTRAKHLESQIQSRVTSELEKLQKAEADRLAWVQDQLSKEDTPSSSTTSPDHSPEGTSSPLQRAKESLKSDEKVSDLSREVVQREIDALKKKLEGRKKVAEADGEVEKAKSEVVACLRAHDRRPLDCWEEVQRFGREVGRLEREWVARNGS